ncbi:argininosuccinate lyase [compost metagenome]
MKLMLDAITVRKDILAAEMYTYIFSVEAVNELVGQGIPFRDAYRQVGNDIAAGIFKPTRTIHHSHEGSIGNLCNDEIKKIMAQTCKRFV